MWALIETRVGNRYNGKVVKTREFEMGEGDPYGLSSRVGACLKSSSGRALGRGSISMSISSKKYLMLWMYGNKEPIQKLTAYVNCSSEHGGSEDSILVWRTCRVIGN